jgi:endonuclease/exonuclease/phosphatase family metal-dependent hydrolase
LRLLTWNLFHGRDFPPDPALLTWRSKWLLRNEHDATHVQVNRPLRAEFATRLAGWEWDVALLQEAPPRWLTALEQATGAVGARDLTSRNALPSLRARLAEWNPDLIGSNEGGSNVLLVRPPARIVATRAETLATRPERRRLLLARLELPDGRRLVVACLHLSVPRTGQGRAEALRAAALATEWGAGDPLVFGGDLNLRPADHRAAFEDLRGRFGLASPTGPRAIDHLLARSLDIVERPAALPAAAREFAGPGGLAIRLSDHAPVVASFGLR